VKNAIFGSYIEEIGKLRNPLCLSFDDHVRVARE
jgi:hypothetical protein